MRHPGNLAIAVFLFGVGQISVGMIASHTDKDTKASVWVLIASAVVAFACAAANVMAAIA